MPTTKPKTHDQLVGEMRAKHSVESKKIVVKQDAATAKKLEKLNKKFGEGSIAILGGGAVSATNGIPTKWRELDDLLTGETDADDRTVPGTGIGMPTGRIIEIYGQEAVGKTTIVLDLIAAAQAAGKRCAYIDAEHALDTKYAKRGPGVDLTRLLFNQPDTAEQAIDVVLSLIAEDLADVIVVDSVAALTPEAEVDDDMGDSHVALQARLIAKACRKLVGPVSRGNKLLIMVNQLRSKIGVTWGSPWTTTGGNSLKFFASVRLEITKVKTLKKGTKTTGIRSRLRTVKNKAAAPFRELFLDIQPNRGIVAIHGDPEFGGDDD